MGYGRYRPMSDSTESMVSLRVNGEPVSVPAAPSTTLLEALREELRLTGTNHGCELGECGACTVLVDGDPRLSCLTLVHEVADRAVTTVEGLGQPDPHPLQEAFVNEGAAQCGYCTPGMLTTATAFLEEHPDPSREEIREAIAGNFCRCTGYVKIIDAIEAAAGGEYP